MKVAATVAVLTAALSIASWTYRFVEEFSPYQDLTFYVLAPAIFWILFSVPLFLLRNKRKAVRILAAILIVRTSALWVVSVFIGFYGLKIHC